MAMGAGLDAAVDDGNAVALVRAGDTAGLDALFGRYAQQVYGFCWHRVARVPPRNEAAEDAMSMVFLQAGQPRTDGARRRQRTRVAVRHRSVTCGLVNAS